VETTASQVLIQEQDVMTAVTQYSSQELEPQEFDCQAHGAAEPTKQINTSNNFNPTTIIGKIE
jgi:hypothetical protein